MRLRFSPPLIRCRRHTPLFRSPMLLYAAAERRLRFDFRCFSFMPLRCRATAMPPRFLRYVSPLLPLDTSFL